MASAHYFPGSPISQAQECHWIKIPTDDVIRPGLSVWLGVADRLSPGWRGPELRRGQGGGLGFRGQTPGDPLMSTCPCWVLGVDLDSSQRPCPPTPTSNAQKH